MIWLIWLGAAVLAVYLYLKNCYSHFSRYGVKTTPIVPLLGNNAPVMLRKKHLSEIMTELYKGNPTERFVGQFGFLSPNVVVKDIDLVKQITVKDYEYFLDHGLSGIKDIDPLFGRTLFVMAGQEWKDMRSTLSPAFTSAKIRNMVPFMVDVGEQMMKSLRKQFKESSTDYIDIETRDLASRYANDVIASCAFGVHVDSHTDRDNEFYKMGFQTTNFKFDRIMKLMGYMICPSLMKKFEITLFSAAVRNFFQNMVIGSIKEREEKGIYRPDMIQLLIEAQKGHLAHDTSVTKDADAGYATVEESDVGKKSVVRAWTDIDLTAQALVFFLAGFETVATTMTFLMYELALNPDVQDKLVKEIKDYDAKNGGKFDYASIQSMTYMDKVVSEVLRKWPPAVVADRLCIKDYNLGKANKDAKDYIIKAGVPVMIPITPIHNDPEFFPNPEKFDPERFSEENKHKIKPWTYLPFGAGPRNCIGSRFALCEVKVMTYQLLQHIEIRPCEKTCIPLELTKDSFNLRIKGGHYLRFKLRK